MRKSSDIEDSLQIKKMSYDDKSISYLRKETYESGQPLKSAKRESEPFTKEEVVKDLRLLG